MATNRLETNYLTLVFIRLMWLAGWVVGSNCKMTEDMSAVPTVPSALLSVAIVYVSFKKTYTVAALKCQPAANTFRQGA